MAFKTFSNPWQFTHTYTENLVGEAISSVALESDQIPNLKDLCHGVTKAAPVRKPLYTFLAC